MSGRKSMNGKTNGNREQLQMRPFLKVAEFSPDRRRELEIGRILRTEDENYVYGEIDPKHEDLPIIARFVDDPDPEVRYSAFFVLSEASDEMDITGLMPDLITALKAGPQNCLELIGLLSIAYKNGGNISPAYEELEDALADGDYEIRGITCDLFKDMAKRSVSIRRTLKMIVRLLNDGEQNVREAAVQALAAAAKNGEIDESSLPRMRRFLGDNSSHNRIPATEFFAHAIYEEKKGEGPYLASDMIKKLTEDDDPFIVKSANGVMESWKRLKKS